MKTFHYNFGGRDVRITFNERRGTVAAVEEDGVPLCPPTSACPSMPV